MQKVVCRSRNTVFCSATSVLCSLCGDGVVQARTHNTAHELAGVDGAAVTHDAKGNLTQTDDGRELTWDFDNRLSRAVVPAGSQRGVGGTHAYTYDANGRRVSKVTGGLQTVFVCAGPRVISEYTTAIGTTANVAWPTQSYVHGSYVDELILKENAAGILYYNRNQQYSIVSLTDSSGSVVERYSYDAYGKTAIRRLNGNERPQSGFDNDYTYTGRRSDPESGLIYFRARYYDAQIAQFISRDPLQYVDGMSQYRAYFVPGAMDPTGELSFKDLAFSSVGWDTAGNLTPPGGIPIPALGARFQAIWYFTGAYFGCCNKKTGKHEHWFKATLGLEAYLIWGFSSGRTPRYEGKGRDRNKRGPDGRKNKHRGNDPIPVGGFRERDWHVDFSGIGECPEPGFSGSLYVFLRGSAGAYYGVQGNIQRTWSFGDDTASGWDFSLHAARGVYGVSVEAGGGGNINLQFPIPGVN